MFLILFDSFTSLNKKLGALALSAALALFLPNKLFGDVYSYECTVLPEHPSAAWMLVQAFCDPQEWIDEGVLVQEVLMCEEFPGEGQQITYTQDIEDLEGVTSWFIEWRVVTTGISEELIYVAPAALVLNDGNGMTYHFTIADDQVRFIRDLALPILYFDIQPNEFHTFRVELFGEDLSESYVVYIDGEIVDSGEAEGPFFNPPWQARVNIRAKAKLVASVTTWDFLRWGGPIQAAGGGDFTGDGEVDLDDVPYFHECLSGPQGSWPGCAWADMDFSGATDCDDWALFVQAWTDPGDPPCLPECECCGDINADNAVDVSDLLGLLAAWGPCADCGDCPAELDGDCNVGITDLLAVLANWGACL